MMTGSPAWIQAGVADPTGGLELTGILKHLIDAPIPNALVGAGLLLILTSLVMWRADGQVWWRASAVALGLIVASGGVFFHLQTTREPAEVLAGLFEAEADRASVLEWLTNEQVFHVDDERLSDAFVELLPEPPGGNADTLLNYARWLSHDLEKQHPALFDLRERALSREKPFHVIGAPVRVGLPGDPEHRPPPCKVNVTYSSRFRGSRVELVNPRNHKRLILFAKPAIPDNLATSDDLIQLNEPQVRYMFDRIVGGTEEALLTEHIGEGVLMDASAETPCPSSDAL